MLGRPGRHRRFVLAGLACGAVLGACPLAAAESPGQGGGHAGEHGGAGTSRPARPVGPDNAPDQDIAREAVSRGLVSPLDRVLATVARVVPGHVVGVRLDRDDAGNWLYHFRVIMDDGRYASVIVNAATNVVVAMEQ
jgi:hypothetical protein